jgi:O-antigen/teichoic acid export membrane protein
VKFISSAKDAKERNTFYTTIKKTILYLAIALSLLIVAISPVATNFLHLDSVLSVALVGPILFFSLITLVNQSTSQGLLKFWGIVGPNLTSSLGKLTFGVLFVYLGYSLTGAIFGVVISAFMAYVLSISIVKGEVNITNFDPKILIPFTKYALPVLGQALAFTSLFTVDVILVKHYFPSQEAGLYAAVSMLGKIIYFAASPIIHVMFPVVSQKKSDGKNYDQVFFISLAATSAIAYGIVVFYKLFPEFTTGLLYGSQYLSASIYLVWMGMFTATYTVCSLLVNFALSLGKTKVVLIPMLVSLLQVFLISIYHNDLFQVIKISTSLVFVLLVSLLLFLGYYRKPSYAKK